MKLMISGQQITLFDYAALDRETEIGARADAALIKGLMRRTVEDVIEIGQALIRQKDRLPHGMFLRWIEAEFEMSQPTASRFMNVAKRYGGKLFSLNNLGLEAVYELASPSTPPEVREEIERRIAAGELASVEDVRSLKQQVIEVSRKATELAQTNEQIEEQNRDLAANAFRRAEEEALKRYGDENAALKRRLESYEAAAESAKSMQEATDDKVVKLQPKTELVKDEDPLANLDENLNDINLEDQRVKVSVIYASLSNIDLAKDANAELFWAIYGRKHSRASTEKWLKSSLKLLNEIKKGMSK